MAEVADKVEQEASAQLSAAEETSTSDKVDTAEKAETNREAATSKSEGSNPPPNCSRVDLMSVLQLLKPRDLMLLKKQKSTK